jgi:chemotaxis methyl-accepting protein methylase
MRKGGFLFMGHSQTLDGLRLPLRQLTANVYRKTDHRGDKR